MMETNPRLLQGTRFTASPQISVSIAGAQTECSPSQEPANRKADLARLRSAVAELLCAIDIRRRGNRTLSEQRIWIAAEQVELELRDVVADTPVLPTPSLPLRGGLPLWGMRKICDFIDANLSSTLRISDLASNANLSHSHFARAFRQSFGETPHAYIVRMRVQRAQTMLLTSVAPLQQIALDCGHSDQSHFSRLFARLVGEAPGARRRARVPVAQTNGNVSPLMRTSNRQQCPFYETPLGGSPENPTNAWVYHRKPQKRRFFASVEIR
jgi:AraC-like DNA-binding protein